MPPLPPDQQFASALFQAMQQERTQHDGKIPQDRWLDVVAGVFKQFTEALVGTKKARAKGPKPGSNIPPSPEEVQAYCAEKGYLFKGDEFCDHYEAKGWKIGSARMVNWQAACRTWAKRDGRKAAPPGKPASGQDYSKW